MADFQPVELSLRPLPAQSEAIMAAAALRAARRRWRRTLVRAVLFVFWSAGVAVVFYFVGLAQRMDEVLR